MASSGTIYYLTQDTSWTMKLTWSSTTNTSTFKTTVSWQLQLYRSSTSTATNTARYSGIVHIIKDSDGTSVENYQFGKDVTLSSNTWTVLASDSFTLTHSTTSGKAPKVLLANQIKASNGLVWTAPSDGYISVNTIIQKATVSSAPNFTDEENPTMTYSNPMGNNVTSLEGCIASENGSIIYVNYRSISKTGSSYTFNLTDAERTTLRNAVAKDTLSVRFYVRSVISGTTYHSYSATKTMTLVSALPTLAPTVVDTNSKTLALTGNSSTFIRGHNAMKFAFNASAKKGASITSYSVTCGAFKSSSSSGTFNNVESGTFVFSVTDSRGHTASKTIELPGVDYVQLTCNQKVQLVMQTRGADAQVHLTVTGDCFSGSFGAKKNDLKIYVRHSEDGGAMGAWGEITPLLASFSGNKYSLTADVSGFDASGIYTFQCKAVDSLGEVVTAEYPVKFTPVFDWGKYDFNFNVPVTIEGNPLVDFVIETGTESMGSNGTWYWAKWASGKAECYGCRNFGNMGVSTAWGGLYRSEAFTQSLPSGLFKNTPEVIDITFRNSNFGAWIAKHETSAPSSSSSGSFIIVRPASATLSQAYIGFNVVGRWK